jgi:predicted nuclease of predicted toxin-antitoxin system
MKLIIDMNMSIKWVEALRQAGFDATHWSSLGRADSPDHGIMHHAVSDDAVVITRDLDFSAILAANGFSKPSVVHLRETDRFSREMVERLVAALETFEAELELGAIVSMASRRVRVRRLPIGRVAPSDPS